MVPTRKRPITWAEVGVRNAGFRKTMVAFQFAFAWGLLTATLGREPESVEEYADFWDVSRAKAFRDQQYWRECFPSELTPGHFNEVSGSQARYNEAWKRLRDISKARTELQSMVLSMGGAGLTSA
jgi:hypothetical protein